MTIRDLPAVAVGATPNVKTTVSENSFSRWNPDIRAAADDADNSISMFDAIGSNGWDAGGITAKRVAAALRQIGERDVVVNINSPGGDFFEGLAIYNLLREHKARVTVNVMGMAASAASIIAMAADDLLIGRSSFLMIHNTWVMAAGDKAALREVADWLAPFDEAAAEIYAARSGVDQAEIVKMLDKETWIGGAAAIDRGFADGLLPSDDIATDAQNQAVTPISAQKKLDLALATGTRLTRSERRGLVAAVKDGGMRDAAPTGTRDAAIAAFALKGLAKLEQNKG